MMITIQNFDKLKKVMEVEIQKSEDGKSRRYYILRDKKPWCIAIADRRTYHAAELASEVHISVIFGDWLASESNDSHITFSCRYGYSIDGQETPAFTLVQEDRKDEIFGKRLNRGEALKHNLLKHFWEVVDEISKVDSDFIAI